MTPRLLSYIVIIDKVLCSYFLVEVQATLAPATGGA